MTLQKKELEIIFLALSETKPSLADARIRDPFLKELGTAIENLNKEKTEIYLEYCDKDDEKNPTVIDGKYHFQDEVINKVNGELITLVEEEVEISCKNPEKLKELIEDTAYSPKPGEVEIIDSFIAKL